MRREDVRWGGLEAVLQPRLLEHARVRDGATGVSFPIVDFEPDLVPTFYDEFPYDFSKLSEWKSAPMLEQAIGRQPRGQRRLDVGCGGGRNVPCLLRGTENVVVFDLSLHSLSRVATQFPVRPARGSVLRLPFVDASFDFLVCDGVAHCTPDPAGAIRELARVTRPGGWIFAALYRSGSLYSFIYKYLGGVLRAARRLETRGMPKIVDTAAFAAYRAASRLLKPGRAHDEAALRTIYEDYFQTPIASFHSPAWLKTTFESGGASIEAIERHGNVWRVLALKKTA
jgi:ubiquinone/menaquinone biosynthesis C-methylase UbiE